MQRLRRTIALSLAVLALGGAPAAAASEEGDGGLSLSAGPLALQLERLAREEPAVAPEVLHPALLEALAAGGDGPDLGPVSLTGHSSDSLEFEVAPQWLVEPGSSFPDTAVQFGWTPSEDLDLRLQGKVVVLPDVPGVPRLPQEALPEVKLAGSVPLGTGWSLGLEGGGAYVEGGLAAPAGAVALVREGPEGTAVFVQLDGLGPVGEDGWSTALKAGVSWEPHGDLVVNVFGLRSLQADEWTVGVGAGTRF